MFVPCSIMLCWAPDNCFASRQTTTRQQVRDKATMRQIVGPDIRDIVFNTTTTTTRCFESCCERPALQIYIGVFCLQYLEVS